MLITKKISHALLLICLSVSVTACGFHLRGSASLAQSAKLIHITAPHGSFELELKDALSRSGAQLSNDSSVSDWNVVISQARHRREIGTLDDFGTVNSFRLVFTVTYRIVNGQGEFIKAPQALSENRQYVYNPSEVVETEFEETALRVGMEKDISLRIVRQLSAFDEAGATANVVAPVEAAIQEGLSH